MGIREPGFGFAPPGSTQAVPIAVKLRNYFIEQGTNFINLR